MKLSGNRCRCHHCGEYFNSLRGFDRHRTGTFKERGVHRRCLSVAELVARGWSKNEDGFWITETFEQRLARAAARRDPGRQLN
jgi:hypothetical protein